MRRTALLVSLSLLVGASAAYTQDATPPAHVYEALFRIGFDDLEEWNRQYREYSVPILQSMVDAGTIEGFDQYEHFVGSEYNIRFVVRTYDWASISSFWAEYLARLEETVPEDEADPHMILGHQDEIWNIREVDVPAGIQTTHLYQSTFRISFGDEDEWHRLWMEVVVPIMEDAMEQGILGGWVKLDHNTGGPHNSKVLYFFEEWDDIDDFFGMLLSQMPERYPEDAARAFGMIRAHDDVIWVPTSTGGAM